MIVIRLTIVMLLLLPTLTRGQSKPEEDDKVSNDNPARPLQMPPASTEVKEALDDFERFQRRGAWEARSRRSTPFPRTRSFAWSMVKTASSFPSNGNAAPSSPGCRRKARRPIDCSTTPRRGSCSRGRGRQRAEEPGAAFSPPISPRPSAPPPPTAWAISTSVVGSIERPIAGWRSSAIAPTRIYRLP